MHFEMIKPSEQWYLMKWVKSTVVIDKKNPWPESNRPPNVVHCGQKKKKCDLVSLKICGNDAVLIIQRILFQLKRGFKILIKKQSFSLKIQDFFGKSKCVRFL